MIRLATATAVFGLIVAACGGQVAEQSVETVPPQGSTSSTTQAPTATDTGDPATTAAPPATTAPVVVDGPPAPDFALALSDGLGFVLSAEQKPVYMVFWAEW